MTTPRHAAPRRSLPRHVLPAFPQPREAARFYKVTAVFVTVVLAACAVILTIYFTKRNEAQTACHHGHGRIEKQPGLHWDCLKRPH